MNIVKNWYWLWQNALSPEFCDLVLKEVDWSKAITGAVGIEENKHGVDKTIRSSLIVWKDIMSPIGTILQAYINAANHYAGWNYDLSSMNEVQIAKYESDTQDFYRWHPDTDVPVDGQQRKLTGAILLNDPSEFEGGMLQIKDANAENLLVSRGSIVVFPSFMLHQVTPVLRGVRYSAVSWMSGPAFR